MLKSIFSLPADLYKNRRLVMKLAKNDFKTRYAGSYRNLLGFRSAGGNNSGILVCIFSGVPVQHR